MRIFAWGRRPTREFLCGTEYHVSVPMFPFYRRGYRIETDEFLTRWWVFSVRLQFVRYTSIGFDVGVRWGWV